MSKRVHLVCIDVQNDFVSPSGALSVKGADGDAARTAAMIERLIPKIDEITLTMDSHHKIDVSHPMWWVDEHGRHPAPFTVITPEEVEAGRWRTRMLSAQKRSLAYLKTLRATNRYPHMIWPEHCLIGDSGHNLFPCVAEAVHKWEERRYAVSNVVTKGSNPWTEHFSAVKAEVPDPEDPGTQINRALVEALEESDLVLWAGEALSHCLANTFRDVVAAFANPEHVKKMVLLTDAASNVGGCEKLGEDFVRDMAALGVTLSTTVDILA